MYAVAEIAGKQYVIEEGKTVAVDRLDAEDGASIDIDKVCLVRSDDGQVKVGKPYVGGAVSRPGRAELPASQDSGVFFRQKKDSRKKRGHRQEHSLLKIEKDHGVMLRFVSL